MKLLWKLLIILSAVAVATATAVDAADASATAGDLSKSGRGPLRRPTSIRNLDEPERTYDCISDRLTGGQKLRRNQYIGPDWACPQGGYRFGLDEYGYLGAWDYDNVTVWHSGIRGDYLRMQKDGNVVLYENDDTPKWSSNCFGRNTGVELRKTGGWPPVAAIDRNETVVWQINPDGEESPCYPTWDERWPEKTCRGDTLAPRVRLFRTEYICNGLGEHVRFGLNARGRLALWHGPRVVWTPSHGQNIGDYITVLRRSGTVVLYQKQTRSSDDGFQYVRQWSTDCYSREAILKEESGGIQVLKRNGQVLWSIDSQGHESGCNPVASGSAQEDCSSVTLFEGNLCQVQMVDFLNMNIMDLQAKALGDGSYMVIDNPEGDSRCAAKRGEAWEVPVQVFGNGTLDIDAGVPDVTCNDILTSSYYQMHDDRQLTFRPHPDFACNKFGRNLIYFMVQEWYYFG